MEKWRGKLKMYMYSCFWNSGTMYYTTYISQVLFYFFKCRNFFFKVLNYRCKRQNDKWIVHFLNILQHNWPNHYLCNTQLSKNSKKGVICQSFMYIFVLLRTYTHNKGAILFWPFCTYFTLFFFQFLAYSLYLFIQCHNSFRTL